MAKLQKGEMPAFLKDKKDGDEKDEDKKEDADKKPNPFKKGKVVKKAASEDAPDDEDADGDEDGDKDADLDKGKVKKSEVSESDLRKSLAALSGFVKSNDADTRKADLLSKAQEGTLSKSEREELFAVLGGAAEKDESTFATDLTKGMESNETLQKSLDVSDYLSEQHYELVKSLGMLGEAIEAVDSRQSEFNLLLAKAVSDVGGVVKSMATRLGAIESQPARAPKSRGIAPLEKSFAGTEPQGERLSKSQVLDAMTSLNEASYKEGRHGLSKSGEDITRAVAKYEQTSALSKAMTDEVRELVQSRRAAR